MKLFSIWSRINKVKLFKEVHFATLDMTKQKRGHTYLLCADSDMLWAA